MCKKGQNYLVQLYTLSYDRSLQHLNNLLAEATADFPNLQADDVCIVVFDGDTKKWIHGIRFTVPESWIAKGITETYFEFNRIESLDKVRN